MIWVVVPNQFDEYVGCVRYVQTVAGVFLSDSCPIWFVECIASLRIHKSVGLGREVYLSRPFG
jgi:hypothetical protein